MSYQNDNGSSNDWDLGGSVSEELIMWPLRRYFDNMLEAEGVDVDDFQRKAGAMAGGISGGLMGTVLLGPIGGIIGGVFGHALGMGANYHSEDQDVRDIKSLCQQLRGEFQRECFRLSFDELEKNVSYETWDEIRKRLRARYERDKDADISDTQAIHIIYRIIASVNENAANQWLAVFKTSLRAARID